jgi:hypothetical protein
MRTCFEESVRGQEPSKQWENSKANDLRMSFFALDHALQGHPTETRTCTDDYDNTGCWFRPTRPGEF